MKNIALLALSAFAAGLLASCCCQEPGAPKLAKMPKFNDLEQPGDTADVSPIIKEAKK